MRNMIRLWILAVLVLALLPWNTAQSQSGWQFVFREEPANPIIAGGDIGEWDHGGNIGHAIIHHQGIFYLFYTGISTVGVSPIMTIGYATSEDGIHWQKAPTNPVVRATTTFEHTSVVTGMVDDDGRWLLVFSESSARIHPESTVFLAMGDSPDGPWEIQPILDMSERSWDNKVVPEGLIKVDGEYRLYYIGMSRRRKDYQMGLAISTDLVNWTLADEPLLRIGAEDEWDPLGVAVSNPIQTETGWELFYVGYDILPTTTVAQADPAHHLWLGYAYSDDGLTWHKYEGNPVIDTGLSAGPFLSLLKVDDTYYLYYDYRVAPAANGIGLMTGTITR